MIKHIQNYENLANAIIETAVKDYRAAKKRLRLHPDDGKARYTIKEVSKFFRSTYYQHLSSTDGEKILRELEDEL